MRKSIIRLVLTMLLLAAGSVMQVHATNSPRAGSPTPPGELQLGLPC